MDETGIKDTELHLQTEQVLPPEGAFGYSPIVSRPKAMIFDWDNTLIDSWPTIHAALNATFRAWNKPEWTLEETRQKVRLSMRDAFPSIFGDVWEKAGEEYRNHYRRLHLEKLTPLDGAVELLELLKTENIPAYIISNKTGDILRREVKHLKWGGYFKVLHGAGDAAVDKPHPDVVASALKGSDLAVGGDIWFVGDSVVDVQCARATGCLPVFYGTQLEYDDGPLDLMDGEPLVSTHEDLIKMLSIVL